MLKFLKTQKSHFRERKNKMRAVIYIILALVTFYVGGIYKDNSIMAVFVWEVIVFVLMIISVVIMKFCVKASFPQSRTYITKGIKSKADIVFENRFVLPVFKVMYRYRCFYNNKKENKALKKTTAIEGRSCKNTGIEIKGNYCGIMKAEVYNVCVRDYMGLFKLRALKSMVTDVVVLPDESSIKIIPCEQGAKGEAESSEKYIDKGGGSSLETYQLKPYEWGEAVKNIHWNIYARTDELYVRDFSESRNSSIIVYIDTEKRNRGNIVKTSAFYEICSAFIKGVVESMGICEAAFAVGKEMKVREIENSEDVNDILTDIYYSDNAPHTDYYNYEKNKDVVIINSDLEIVINGRVVMTFSQEMYESEILKAVIEI